jgi:hypothetical protein
LPFERLQQNIYIFQDIVWKKERLWVILAELFRWNYSLRKTIIFNKINKFFMVFLAGIWVSVSRYAEKDDLFAQAPL